MRPLLLDLQLVRHDRERLPLLEVVEHRSASEDGAHLLWHRVDEGRALLLGADAGGVLFVTAATEDLLNERPRRGIDDAAHLFVGGNFRQLLRDFDRAVESAELVNESSILSLRARPDATARDLVD